MNDDRISEVYHGKIWSVAAQERARRRVHWLCSKAVGEAVLDIGCSQGIASILLGREGFRVTGIDIQESRIDYARADLAAEAAEVQTRVDFMVANGSSLEFEADSFDTVLLGEVLEHLAVPGKLLDEACRVLKPGGRVVITTPFGLSAHHDHKQTFYPSALLKYLAEYFVPVSIEIVDRYFRIVAVKNAVEDPPDMVDPWATLDMLDEVISTLDRSLSDEGEQKRQLRHDLEKTRSALAEQTRMRLEAQQTVQELNARHLADQETIRSENDARVAALLADQETIRSENDARVAALLADHESQNLKLMHRIKAIRRDSSARIELLEDRLNKLEQDRWRLHNRLALSQWKLKSMTQRKWWRLGVAAGRLRSNPLRILILPFDVVSIVFSKSNLPPKPKQSQRPSSRRNHSNRSRGSSEKQQAPASSSGKRETTSAASDAPQFRVPRLGHQSIAPKRDLFVATLLDEFSENLFMYEFESLPVTPDGWREVLERDPVLLLVESAWRGSAASWHHHIAKEEGPSAEFRSMVAAFREAGIPTVFWNKEDPPNYRFFVEAAKLFDIVFTVCEECIPQYHEDLGHDRVYLLPFAAQPRIHNPISVGARDGGVAFAGTYYAAKHPDRVKQVEVVLDPARDFDLGIFTRVASSGNYKWPDRFEPFIVGSLAYEDMLIAYKMFKVFLNVNSVVDSVSMCARRVFELAASGTPVVSGASPAISRFFGDIVTQTADAAETRDALKALLESEEMRARVALQGVRTVMREHTASHRVDEILDRAGIAGGRSPALAPVTLVLPIRGPDDLDRALAIARRQTYSNLQLVIPMMGFEMSAADLRRATGDSDLANIELFRVDSDLSHGAAVLAGFRAADGEYVGSIDVGDYYGGEFVWDLMDAFSYTEARIVGKRTHYWFDGEAESSILMSPGHENTYVETVVDTAMLVDRSVFEVSRYSERPDGGLQAFVQDASAIGVRVYSSDRFNYLRIDRVAFEPRSSENLAPASAAASGFARLDRVAAHVTV